jgi:SET domain-containing protein
MFALDDGRVIDATTRGNVARYINHSCGGGNGSVQTNNLTGKTEAKGKGVSRSRHL